MIYTLRHRTTYEYESQVKLARCVLRLTPPTTRTQTVMNSAITVSPRATLTHERVGPFGATTTTVLVETPHKRLVIEARAMVEVHTRAVGPLSTDPSWEKVRTLAFGSADLSTDGPAAYLYPTPRTPLIPEITEYARASFAPGRPVIEATADLMKRIHADFTYDSKATDVRTKPEDAFRARRGVCQDFTHIMLSGLRGLGLPGAYVSGYLRTTPPPGRPRLEGADATHAWVSLWCGETRRWIGFDPTNAILVENDHIVLAVGRDYADVAPIDGIILAPGQQTLKVEVDVIPQDEAETGLSPQPRLAL
jgi:transglutaminase-like putative cysteine protease